MKTLQGAGIDNVFFWKNAHNLFRGATSTKKKWCHDVFGHSAHSAIYYKHDKAGSPLGHVLGMPHLFNAHTYKYAEHTPGAKVKKGAPSAVKGYCLLKYLGESEQITTLGH
jgi:hypothetical protein